MNKKIAIPIIFILILVSILILCTVTLGVAAFFLGRQSGVSLTAKRTPAPVPATVIPTMPPLPKAMTATPTTNAASATSSLQVLIFTNDSATQALQEEAAQSGTSMPLKVQTVSFTREQITITGDLDYMGIQGNLSIFGKPVLSNKKLQFKVSRVTLDGEDLPDFMFPTIEEQINATFDQWMAGYSIESMELSDGQMTLTIAQRE